MTTTLIEQYLEWLRRCGRSPRTINARRKIFARVDADLPHGLSAATADELADWLYRDTWSPGTRETYHGALRSFYVWATNPIDPHLDFDPSQLLPRPRVPRRLPRPCTTEQLRHILTHAAEPWRLWSVLAAYAGLRCCEISQLDRSDVDQRAVTIRRGKGGRPGVVPTHPAVWAAVRDLPLGPLAWDDHGGVATAQWISIRTAVYFRRRLGLPGVALHRLRHWYGTSVYRATRDIRVTQELMRHATPATTAGYTLIDDEERAAGIRALPTLTSTSTQQA